MIGLPQHDSEKATRILSVTRELLLKHGFRGVTIAQIAERAHVGKGTVYLYWNTKEDLCVELVTRDFLAAVEEYVTGLENDPHEILPRRLLPMLVRSALGHPFVRAIQLEDADILGLLADHPATRQVLAVLGPGALPSAVLPVLRKHGLVRLDWDLNEQLYAMRGLVTGFFQLTANTMANPAFAVENPEGVFAATVRLVLEPGEPVASDVAAAAGETIRLLTDSCATVTASLSSAKTSLSSANN